MDIHNNSTLAANGFIKAADSASIDGFGRWRVSEPHTVFDSKQLLDNGPLFWDDSEVSGSGTSSTWDKNKASSVMAVSATTAGKRVRQTFMRHNYQPGKSQQIFMTFTMGTQTSGVTKQVGLFNDDNGIFFEDDGTDYKVVLRSKQTGSVVDTEITQENWNLNTLQGTTNAGQTGTITLDPTKSLIFAIDIEWLGVGRVRCGFVIDGLFYYVHEFLNANNVAGVYMSTPNLPLRYAIENDGTGGATDLEHICSSVISEGGQEDNGVVRYASTGGTEVTCSTENITYAIIGMRLKSTHLDETVKLIKTAIQIQTASENIEWTLVFNPTVAGTFTYNDLTNSAVQIATGATTNTVTGGTELDGGYAISTSGGGGAGVLDNEINNALRLGAAIDGTLDTIVLCATPRGGATGVDIEGSLTWRELT